MSAHMPMPHACYADYEGVKLILCHRIFLPRVGGEHPEAMPVLFKHNDPFRLLSARTHKTRWWISFYNASSGWL